MTHHITIRSPAYSPLKPQTFSFSSLIINFQIYANYSEHLCIFQASVIERSFPDLIQSGFHMPRKWCFLNLKNSWMFFCLFVFCNGSIFLSLQNISELIDLSSIFLTNCWQGCKTMMPIQTRLIMSSLHLPNTVFLMCFTQSKDCYKKMFR